MTRFTTHFLFTFSIIHIFFYQIIENMATVNTKTQCIKCGKDKVAYQCDGCLQRFCLNHLNQHNQELEKQLDEINDSRNLLQQNLIEQKNSPEKNSLFEQINQWENKSITIIKRTANEARNLLFDHINEHLNKIEIMLNQLTKQLKDIRQENNFNEIILLELKQK